MRGSVQELGETFETHPIGEYLRRQRILRGMSAEELADLTRIPIRSLERLESGQFDGQTDGFVRGFVRTVAGALGLDANDTLARMLEEPEPSVWERHSTRQSLRQALALLLLIVVLAMGFLGLRAVWRGLVGAASTTGERAVVLWQDPVRSLAEATGASPADGAPGGVAPGTEAPDRDGSAAGGRRGGG